MPTHKLAGQKAPQSMLIDINKLLDDYYSIEPAFQEQSQQVSFGTSGHRGSSSHGSFNQAHIYAIAQAICDFRKTNGIDGPLYMGKDTHALSGPAQESALEVLAANGVEVFIQSEDGYTPTPVISHAILSYNHGKKEHLADGIVITPSHNPPSDGGIKYNPPNGGPADTKITAGIQDRANQILKSGIKNFIKRMPFKDALKEENTHLYDFIQPYLSDLKNIIDFEPIVGEKIKIGADPLGGSTIQYWNRLTEFYHLDLTVVNQKIEPAFSFMTLDHDGKIRMDCSSGYAMASLTNIKDDFDIAFGNDPDGDRHGIVTPSSGLLNPNHYLAVSIDYLFNRRQWPFTAMIGKTLVSSAIIDRVARDLGRKIAEVPVGFKWFVPGLLNGEYAFGGEESAGASFLRHNGKVCTTDKDGIIMNLLAAEITALTGKDPGWHFQRLAEKLGHPFYTRIDSPCSPQQKAVLKKMSPQMVSAITMAGEPIEDKMTKAPANQAPIGGLKVTTKNGWFAARPSGTENIYKIYAESFKSQSHLDSIIDEARYIVEQALTSAAN